jgi:hypothetical protein
VITGRHPYRNSVRGRSITTRSGVGGVTITAHLTCSLCGFVGNLPCRAIMPPDQMDRKFRQHGWAVDPHLCPNCLPVRAKEKIVGTPSVDAMKAQAHMFRLLSDHFDPAKGRFAPDWNDTAIAKATGLALNMVTEFRQAAFGEIKEPEELQQIRADINAIEQLARESFNQITEQVALARGQLAKLAKAA